MSHESHDYRVTAYVFGEMSPTETAAFELELERSAELQAEVNAIRETVDAVQAEFAGESVGVGDEGRRRIEGAIAGKSLAAATPQAVVIPLPTKNTTKRTTLIGLAVAATVLLLGSLAIPALRKPQGVAVNDERRSEALIRRNVAVKSEQLDARKSDFGVTSTVTEEALRDGNQNSEKLERFFQDSPALPGPGDAPEMAELGRDASPTTPAKKPQANDLGDAGIEALRTDAWGRATAGVDNSVVQDATKVVDSDGNSFGVATGFARETAPLAVGKQVGNARGVQARGESLGAGGAVSGGADSYDTGLGRADGGGKNDANLSIPLPNPVQTATLPHPVASSAPETKFRTVSPNSQPSSSRSRRIDNGREKQLAELELAEVGAVNRENDKFAFGFDDGAQELGTTLLPGGDRYDPITDNPFMPAIDSPLSTFSIDVDTAAYAKVRMYLMQQNSLPRPNAVRIEEMLNYFSYDYAPPSDEHPFAATVAVAQCPWNSDHRLARVALKGRVIEADRPASNLVFLLDVSGSMNKPNKHPFVVEGMKMLTKQLTENDQVAIVVYAGAAGLVLDSTCGDDKEIILSSLDRLRAGGSTNGAQGIQLAYETARDNFIVGGTNRVILCTDGDFNVGVTSTDDLVKIAEENAQGNIFLSVLGFGMGNHNDAMMEQISNKGNGNYAFIDSEREAQKVLVEQMGGTLVTIAKDVKIQIEFNPAEVADYRLIGYENRVLAAEDFNDDTKDAGEIGAGHTVTALYELVPAKGKITGELPKIDVDNPAIDDFRYRKQRKLSKLSRSGELLELKLRYKQPTGTESTLIRTTVKDEGKTFAQMDKDFKFAASVASFGMLLRHSPHKGNATFAGIEEMVPAGIGPDKSGRRTEFLQMVTKAKVLSGEK